jgi:hypothetical protein
MPACAAQHDDSLRLSEELGRARADAAWQKERAAQLESRMSQLEQRVASGLSTRRPEDREVVSRLERLIDMNERLLLERAAAGLPASAPAAAGLPPSAPAAATSGTPAGGAPTSAVSNPSARPLTLSEEQELRALVERLRGHAGTPRGGLTREQEAALRVLTRPERKLDAESPWAAGIY